MIKEEEIERIGSAGINEGENQANQSQSSRTSNTTKISKIKELLGGYLGRPTVAANNDPNPPLHVLFSFIHCVKMDVEG